VKVTSMSPVLVSSETRGGNNDAIEWVVARANNPTAPARHGQGRFPMPSELRLDAAAVDLDTPAGVERGM